ncbi:hypothetical protein SAMN05444167_2015 [Terriglobus roseus]|uniref:Uncharacterized protein n=1 Tax=Terriglobus roseus TaxID=392734 RepID=A0A1G7K1N5_9BACT|nr:hypothetical protein SAMN05444167_2015 [Terriglobus roseus]
MQGFAYFSRASAVDFSGYATSLEAMIRRFPAIHWDFTCRCAVSPPVSPMAWQMQLR